MFHGRFRIATAFVLIVTAISCRGPQPIILEDPSVGYLYDPKTTDAIEKGAPSSEYQRELNARYRTALAEPVSVVAWEDDHSVSEIFFATNRIPRVTTDGTAQFENAWGQQLTLGTCRVTLPRRERGKSVDGPKRSVRFASWLPVLSKLADKEQSQLAVNQIRSTEPTYLLNAVRRNVDIAPEHDVLLFVHGFNVDFAGSVTRAAQIAIDLPFNGAVIAYSWPSQGGINNYATDEKVVADSVTPFIELLDQLNHTLPPAARIHVVVHSMGNRLVLNALSRLSPEFRQPPRFENVVLAAPDVGVSDFATLCPQAVNTAKRITLYVNASDTALIASKGLHNEQRIGDAFPPVVAPGIETIDASAIDTSFMGHSYYGSNRRALSDMFALIKENRGAAQRRWLRQESEGAHSWWTFASQPAEIRFVWYFDHLANHTPAR